MKWIGQHIYDLASRFRNDVFLEDISTGTIASGAHLGLDSNNKIVKAVDGGGDLTSIVAGTGLSGTSLTGPIPTLSVDATQAGITGLGTITSGTWQSATAVIASQYLDGDTAHLTTDQTFTGNKTFDETIIGSINGSAATVATIDDLAPNTATTQATQPAIESIGTDGDTLSILSDTLLMSNTSADTPVIKLVNTTNDDQAGQLIFEKLRADDAVAQGQNLGEIWFRGQDAAQNTEDYAYIIGEIDVSTSGQESGSLALGVASHDGSNRTGFKITGGDTGEVDVNIGLGSGSITTIVGTLTMGSTVALGNNGKVVVANQSNITGVGTITSGVWNGDVIASAYLDADTAHLAGAQTFTGTKTLNSFKGTGGATVTNILDEDAMGSDSATALATQQSIKAYADRPAKQIVLMRAAFKDDIGTAKHYIPLQSELEQTNSFHEMNSFVAPFDGKLLKLMYNGSGNFSGGEFSFTLEQIPRNVAFATTPTVLETIAIDGPTNDTTDPNMIIANFVGGSGTNSFTAGDLIMVGIQSDADVTSSTSKHFFTLVFEFDFSSLA